MLYFYTIELQLVTQFFKKQAHKIQGANSLQGTSYTSLKATPNP